jgi:phosphatidate cytidylyltransferase
MLHTRLWVGSLLALGAGGILLLDGESDARVPYPFLLACLLALGFAATRELLSLLPAADRPRQSVTTFGVLLVLAANWVPALRWGEGVAPPPAWEMVLFALLVAFLVAFLVELASYTGPGNSTARVAYTAFAVVYLGVCAVCFARIRFDAPGGALALAAAVFVPKCGDIGAYFTGRLIGRHPFTPNLSPKKTWEGFAGGMAFAVGTAVGVHFLGPVFRYGPGHAVAFGLVVGLLGVLGDLAESMIKRDAQAKDASRTVPGFGGVLDVIDSVLFAAPVAYLLLR